MGDIWRQTDSQFALAVPFQIEPGGLDWQQVVRRLATVENTDPEVLTERLSGRPIDVANLRAANDIVIRDTIPYVAGVAMVRESWTMLRSSATTSMGAKSHIRRYRPSADEIVATSRMGHTKRGSFVIPIYLSLPEPTQVDETLLSDEMQSAPETRERRVMRTFAESLAAVDALVVTPEMEPPRDTIHDLVRSGVSHEFAAALHRILCQESVSEFGATFEWAPDAGPAPATAATVAIPSSARERVKNVATRLRTEAPARTREYLTGPIVGVHRDDQDRTGVVTIQVSRNARLAHVSVNVSRERLDEALDWMKARSTVVVDSLVHRSSSGLTADASDAVALLSTFQLSH